MPRKMTLSALPVVLALSVVALGPIASARNADTVSVRVSYSDLDLATRAGAMTVLQRITIAARDVCGPVGDPTQYAFEFLPCVRDTTARAVMTLASPVVTALFDQSAAAKPTALASNRPSMVGGGASG